MHRDGFADDRRSLTLSLASAFDLSISLAVAGVDTRITVTGEEPALETARSQIAGTLPQAEVQSLPLNGRNFLDLALLIPGVSPTNIGSTQLFAETSAVPASGHLGRQSTQSLEQLHRRRPVGQRRCRRPQRHPVRRGRGGAVPGRDLGRAGRARAGARRLRERRHAQRHQRGCTGRSTTSSATIASTPRTRCRARRCRWTSSSTAAASAGRWCATGRSTSRTSSSACSIRRARHHPQQNVAVINAKLNAVGYQGGR